MTSSGDTKSCLWICPNGDKPDLHDKTEIEVAFINAFGHVLTDKRSVGVHYWLSDGLQQTIAYRVIKEYREPREIWAVYRGDGFRECPPSAVGAVKFREVIK